MVVVRKELPNFILEPASCSRSIRKPGFIFTQYGVQVGVVPGGVGFDTEIWWAPDNGLLAPASSAALQLARLFYGSYSYTHIMPLTTGRQFYQARHVAAGYTPGNYTPWVSAVPVGMFPDLHQMTDPVGVQVDDLGNVYVRAGTNIFVGDPQNSTSNPKSIRLYADDFLAVRSSVAYSLSGLQLSGETTDINTFGSRVLLPAGVIATKARVRFALETSAAGSGSTAQGFLIKTDDDGNGTTLFAMAAATSNTNLGFISYESTGFSITPTSSFSLGFAIAMVQGATVASALANSRTRFLYAELDYSVSNYGATI